MSYSFSVRATTRPEALALLTAKFDAEVLAHQPAHTADRAAVLANAEHLLNVVQPPTAEEHDFVVGVNGSLSTTDGRPQYVSLNMSIQAVRRA